MDSSDFSINGVYWEIKVNVCLKCEYIYYMILYQFYSMKRRTFYKYLDKLFGTPIVILLALFFKRYNRLPGVNIKNILLIKFAAIGDTILLIPTLRKIKEKFPEAKLTFICSPINESIVKKIPYVDEIVVIKVYSFLTNPFFFLRTIKQLRKLKYDIVIDAGQWERISVILLAFLRYHFSVGFKTRKQFKHFLYDDIALHKPDKHELENFLDLLIPIGITIDDKDKNLEYFLSEKDFKFADDFWEKHGLFNHTVICFHPGCGENGAPREWAIENYIALGKRLLDYDENIRILITGAPVEVERCNEISAGISANTINTAGKFELDNVVALVSKSKLVVCSNTGMLHIAGSVGVKTLGLHGPTNPVKWSSYSKNSVVIQSDKFCSPCLYLGHEYGCQTPTCMAHITVDDVFISIRKALNPELFRERKVVKI